MHGNNSRLLAQLRANNSFKPKLFRSGKGMAEKACHAFASTTQFGLTQALGSTSRSARHTHDSEDLYGF